MENPPRYAIYYAPAPGSALDHFGATILGYDAQQAVDLPFPNAIGLPDWSELTRDPRRYGFHATLKAPMALAPGADEDAIVAACAAFAAMPRAIPVIRPVVDTIDGFAAIVPAQPSAELEDLAAACVRDFDSFRAPLTEQDRARRNPAKLSQRQRDYLDRWGYPYVFDEFRFHMTLTGRLDAGRRTPVLETLRRLFGNGSTDGLAIDRIALFRQGQPDQRFRVIGNWPLQHRASAS